MNTSADRPSPLLKRHLRPIVIALVVALQVTMVTAAVAREEYFLRTGEEIVLQSIPVDPRDLLRGDYVILGYAAENIGQLPGDYVPPGENAYVVFEQRGAFWEPVSIHRNPESRSSRPAGSVLLKGKRLDETRIEYANLGRYYIPEGAGEPPSLPAVVVVVNGDGSTRIKRLVVDGRPWP